VTLLSVWIVAASYLLGHRRGQRDIVKRLMENPTRRAAFIQELHVFDAKIVELRHHKKANPTQEIQ
jgi:hypothetical protein